MKYTGLVILVLAFSAGAYALTHVYPLGLIGCDFRHFGPKTARKLLILG